MFRKAKSSLISGKAILARKNAQTTSHSDKQSDKKVRSRDRDHPGQHGETPSLLKIEKLAGCGGARL